MSRRASSSEQLDDLGELLLAAEEGCRGDGQVRAVERLERRESRPPELVERVGCGEVLEPVSPRSTSSTSVEQLDGVAGEHDLAAVRRAHDPGGAVDVHADVLGRVEGGFAGVDPDPDPDRAASRPAIASDDRSDGGLGGGEGVEEGVALVVDLVAVVAGARSRTTRRCSASASR